MSHVDNWLLITPGEEDVTVECLNSIIVTDLATWESDEFFKLVSNGAGGSKHMERDVWAGAGFVPNLSDAVASMKWDDPACVQLFLCGENDDLFGEVPLGLERPDWIRPPKWQP